MTLSNLPPLVTVFGGSGFVGRSIVRALARRGYRIRVAVRRPDLAFFLQPIGNMGQISFVQANLRYRASVDAAVAGADHVVNCVGILFESGRNSFDAVQEFGARAVAEAARSAGASLTHISAIGADAKSASSYARTKGRAEEAVLSIKPDAIILRPSIVFGQDDSFFNKFGRMSQTMPFLPLIGGGKTRFQPVFVEDVAEAAARAVDGKLTSGATYELGGPAVMTFKDCLETVLSVVDRRKPLISLPFGLASLMGSVASMIPFVQPPLTADQVTLLKADNVVSKQAIDSGRTLPGIGIVPTMVDTILPIYMVQYRPQGQFRRSGRAA